MADEDKKPKADKAAAAKGGKGAPQGGKGKRAAAEKADKGPAPAPRPKDYKPRMKKLYEEQIRATLIKEFGYKNPLEVPKIDKIVLNMGVGDAVNDTKKVTTAAGDLGLIAGQKPVVTHSRKAIATFKLREGQAIGAKVTLRKSRMYDFIDRLVNIALPRVRDFRGLNPKSFDGMGNYSLGLKEHIVFPEIDYDKSGETWGMDITICTTAADDEQARALLTAFNFPFRQ